MGDLKKYIKEANLVFPDYNNLNIIDLMETIYARFGYETNNSAKKNYLNKLIPNNIHYLFVISDGTGINLFDKLDNYSTYKKDAHLTLEEAVEKNIIAILKKNYSITV